MSIRFLLLLILFTHFPVASRSGVVTSSLPYPMEQLTLSTSLIGRRFCSGDAEVAVLQARLKLQYTNNGQQPVILSKNSVEVSSLIISRTVADAIAGNREMTLDFHIVSAEDPRIAPRNYDAEFVVISAGESYYAETMAPVVFTLSSKAVAGAVPPGPHVLQVQISTFPSVGKLREYGEQLARQKEYSWRDYVVSVPMTFAIEPTLKLETCN